MHLPWLRFRGRHDLVPGDKVHEVHGPMLLGGFRMSAHFSSALIGDEHGVLCEQGDALSGWAWFLADGVVTWVLSDGRAHRLTAPIPVGAELLVVDATPAEGGGVDLVLHADGRESVAAAHVPVAIPAAWSPDGAFLTVGYGRPFAVCGDYSAPSPAPESFAGVRIDAGPPPPFDFDEMLADVMRHQ